MSLLGILNSRYFLLFSILLGAFLRFHNLTDQSYWQDEIFSAKLIEGPFWEKLKLAWKYETHPPLYIVLQKIWTYFFGYTEYSMRACSATIGTATLLVLYPLIRLLSSQTTASLTVFLFAISPFAIYYSQEVRSYALWLPLTMGSFYYFFQWLYHSKNTYLIWAIITVLSLYTHIYTLFVLFIQFIVFLYEIYDKGYNHVFINKKYVKHFGGASLILFLGILSLIEWAILHYDEDSGFYRTFSLAQFPYVIFTWMYGYSFGPTLSALHVENVQGILSQWWLPIFGGLTPALIILPFAFSVIWFDRRQRLLFLMFSFCLILIVLSTFFSKIMFNVRYSIFLVPFFYMYLAIGTEKVWRLRFIWSTPLLVVCLMLISLYQYYYDPEYARDDVRSTSSTILTKPEIPVLTTETMKKYFLTFYGNHQNQNIEIMNWDTIKADSSSDQLWLIWNRPWTLNDAKEYQKYFEQNYKIIQEEKFPGVNVQRIVKQP